MILNVIKNFGSITSLRIVTRVFEFFLKTYLIRNILDKEILAHMINLDLILTSSLHIVKSCLKPSYQRVQNPQNSLKSAMNVMTLGIVATVVSAIIVCFIEQYHFLHSHKKLIFFQHAIYVYGLSAICESIAQKYMARNVLEYRYFRMGMIQMASFLPKTVFIFIAAQMDLFTNYGILIFGVGQLIYSALLMIINYLDSPNKTLLIQSFQEEGSIVLFDHKSKQSLKEFSILSFLKLILQEFERIVLIVMDVAEISSVYTLISNLGSIIIRYFFHPLNEIVFNYFSRGDQKESISTLITFVKGLVVFSFLSFSFGYNYSQSFLLLLYGEKWVDQESVSAMTTYACLLPFLGFNGIIEAFTFARGKESISKYKYFSVLTTGIYLFASFIFLKLDFGASGLFLSNIVGMSSRIILCWVLQISSHMKLTAFITGIKPSVYFITLSLILFLLSHKTYGLFQNIFANNYLTILLGGIIFCLNLSPIILENRHEIVTFLKNKREKGKSE